MYVCVCALSSLNKFDENREQTFQWLILLKLYVYVFLFIYKRACQVCMSFTIFENQMIEM